MKLLHLPHSEGRITESSNQVSSIKGRATKQMHKLTLKMNKKMGNVGFDFISHDP